MIALDTAFSANQNATLLAPTYSWHNPSVSLVVVLVVYSIDPTEIVLHHPNNEKGKISEGGSEITP